MHGAKQGSTKQINGCGARPMSRDEKSQSDKHVMISFLKKGK
jgi:hypothetical protein